MMAHSLSGAPNVMKNSSPQLKALSQQGKKGLIIVERIIII